MPIPANVVQCLKYLDRQKESHIEELRKLISIANVSSDPNAGKQLSKVVQWMSNRLKGLGFQVVLHESGDDKDEGHHPLIIIGSLGKDPKKITLLYYCHLDVLKIRRYKWIHDPFELTEEEDGKLVGRGAAKMKGPLLCFLHAIEAYRELGIELPINLKIVCESMHECKSRGLSQVLEQLKSTFLANVDCIALNESRWIGKSHPCIVYGMRGVCYFDLKISGPRRSLASGDYGGIVREPMSDLLHILKSLVDPFGNVKMSSLSSDVQPVTPDEESFYHKIKTNKNEYRANVGVNKLGHDENLKLVLMHVWRYPWFNLHFINTSNCVSLLDIPNEIHARFSIRTVPNQKHERIVEQTLEAIDRAVAELETPNRVEVKSENCLDPWVEDHDHWNYEAANLAIRQVYKEEASFIREGNGFPTLLKLRDAMPGRNILVLPIVDCESKVHRSGENISKHCYVEGGKLFAAYFAALAERAPKRTSSKSNRSSRSNKPSAACRHKMY
ncbi:hypothetical protein TKK_0014938 [Trichogramma kaykai]|uniref:Peptidase M20 dimerisation domain-containing protein n=1 Tax=Trichogramma kaykai TaxID=54128 RepID=A0ABD2WC88_9HYME